MQAVIALCHFCENHGPRVVMTCQPMRDMDLPATSLSPSTSSAPDGPTIPVAQIQRNSELSQRFREGLPLFYGDCRRSVMDTEDRCKACTSFGNGPCLLSNDHPNKTSYISSEIAFHDRVYDRVKSACLRSLSCEVSAPQKNSQQKRRETVSINSQPILISPVNCDIIFERSPDEADGNMIFGDNDNGFCFSHTFRLQDAKARGRLRLFSLNVVSNDLTLLTSHFEFLRRALTTIKEQLQGMASLTYARETSTEIRPEHGSIVCRMAQFRREIAIDTGRNLETITGNDNIWTTLHRQMMWTLRSPILSCHDQVMEGVPTQDMLVMMELDAASIVELELHHPNQHEVSMQQLSNLKQIARKLCDENEIDLDLLIKQVVTGNQVIVESADPSLCRQFLLAVSNLLPIGCLKLSTYKEYYTQESIHRFTLIGGPPNMDIPLDLDDVLVLCIISNGMIYGDENVSLRGCRIQVKRRPALLEKCPQIVGRYKKLLLDSEVVDTVLETTLRSTREFWMGKAKLFYQMQKQISQAGRTELMRFIKGINNEDFDVVSFWQEGLSKAYKDHVLATIEYPDEHSVLG
ncbi:unnamed protein product [Caenorhabditis auriculariae]|uniref:Folliculin n=1 Tax=Caenorhabditis auriculariae TaxID=2777116 RepID=A0A8S1HWD1_9PELO|nr:unnamed protein product [Caenorhabditis auriculariae]